MTAAVEVTAGVISHDEKILVCQRAAGSRHAGKWEFPGGKREPGESLEQCLRRELEEELGIVAEIGRVLAQTRHHYEGRGVIELTFFAVDAFAGTPANLVFAQICWVRLANLAGLDFLEADRDFVEKLASGTIQI